MPRISDYPIVTLPADADVFLVVQGGVTKKVAFSQIKSALIDNATVLGAEECTITDGIDSVIVGGYDNHIAVNQGSTVHSSVIAGGEENALTDVDYAAILGGLTNAINGAQTSSILSGQDNTITGDVDDAPTVYGTVIAGGEGNAIADSDRSSILGGLSNQIVGSKDAGGYPYGKGATINGGVENLITITCVAAHNNVGREAIGGGGNNAITLTYAADYDGYATIGGGYNNSITASFGTIPGGLENTVSGECGYAAGRRSHATAAGAFAMSDSTDADFTNAVENSFAARFAGGYNFTGGRVKVPSIQVADDAADATLSGTPKIFTLYDSEGTPYYVKGYPTKA